VSPARRTAHGGKHIIIDAIHAMMVMAAANRKGAHVVGVWITTVPRNDDPTWKHDPVYLQEDTTNE
jgi:hypothetical protein